MHKQREKPASRHPTDSLKLAQIRYCGTQGAVRLLIEQIPAAAYAL
jgi:hypothetical protein